MNRIITIVGRVVIVQVVSLAVASVCPAAPLAPESPSMSANAGVPADCDTLAAEIEALQRRLVALKAERVAMVDGAGSVLPGGKLPDKVRLALDGNEAESNKTTTLLKNRQDKLPGCRPSR